MGYPGSPISFPADTVTSLRRKLDDLLEEHQLMLNEQDDALFRAYQERDDWKMEAERLQAALRRMVEHTPLDTLTYEQMRELGRQALEAQREPSTVEPRKDG